MTGILALAADRANLGGPFLEAAPSTFTDRFKASWDEALAPDRWFNAAASETPLWQDLADKLHTATGQTFAVPRVNDPAPDELAKYGSVSAVDEARKQAMIEARNNLLQDSDVGADLPDPGTFDQQIHAQGEAIRNKAASLVGTGGGLGAFFGAMAAPTPENLAAFLIPPSRLVLGARLAGEGFLAGVGREALYQAGTNAALTAASDLADVPGGAKQLSDIPGDVAGAAVGGAILGGGFHTLVHGPAALFARWNALPQAARDAAPLEARDAFNVLGKEALYSGQNRLGLDPLLHDRYQGNALDAIMRQRPVNLDEITPADTPMTALASVLRQPEGADIRGLPDFTRLAALPDSELGVLARHLDPESATAVDKAAGDLETVKQKIDTMNAEAIAKRPPENMSDDDLIRQLSGGTADVDASASVKAMPAEWRRTYGALQQQMADLGDTVAAGQTKTEKAVADMRASLEKGESPAPAGMPMPDVAQAMERAEFDRMARAGAESVGQRDAAIGKPAASDVGAKINTPQPEPDLDVSKMLKGKPAAPFRKELLAELGEHEERLKDAHAIAQCVGMQNA